jgi:hypothetical protein
MNTAVEKGLSDPDKARSLASEVIAKPRAFDDIETAGLVHRANDLKNKHADIMDKVGKAKNDAETASLAAEANRIEEDFDLITTALRKSGTEKGRALAAQKLTINQDFALVSVKNRAKAAKGSALTAEQEASFAEQTKKLEELSARVAQLEKELAEQKAKHAIKVHKAVSRMTVQERQTAKSKLVAELKAMARQGCE